MTDPRVELPPIPPDARLPPRPSHDAGTPRAAVELRAASPPQRPAPPSTLARKLLPVDAPRERRAPSTASPASTVKSPNISSPPHEGTKMSCRLIRCDSQPSTLLRSKDPSTSTPATIVGPRPKPQSPVNGYADAHALVRPSSMRAARRRDPGRLRHRLLRARLRDPILWILALEVEESASSSPRQRLRPHGSTAIPRLFTTLPRCRRAWPSVRRTAGPLRPSPPLKVSRTTVGTGARVRPLRRRHPRISASPSTAPLGADPRHHLGCGPDLMVDRPWPSSSPSTWTITRRQRDASATPKRSTPPSGRRYCAGRCQAAGSQPTGPEPAFFSYHHSDAYVDKSSPCTTYAGRRRPREPDRDVTFCCSRSARLCQTAPRVRPGSATLLVLRSPRGRARPRTTS